MHNSIYDSDESCEYENFQNEYSQATQILSPSIAEINPNTKHMIA